MLALCHKLWLLLGCGGWLYYHCCWASSVRQTIYLSFVWWPWHILSVGADVTQTHKWHCLTIILFGRGLALGKKENTFRKFISATTPKNSFSHSLEPLTEDLIVLVHIVFYIHSLVVESVESIYYQSAQHVLASPDFWAILWWIFLQKCNKYKNCAHPPFNPE